MNLRFLLLPLGVLSVALLLFVPWFFVQTSAKRQEGESATERSSAALGDLESSSGDVVRNRGGGEPAGRAGLDPGTGSSNLSASQDALQLPPGFESQSPAQQRRYYERLVDHHEALLLRLRPLAQRLPQVDGDAVQHMYSSQILGSVRFAEQRLALLRSRLDELPTE